MALMCGASLHNTCCHPGSSSVPCLPPLLPRVSCTFEALSSINGILNHSQLIGAIAASVPWGRALTRARRRSLLRSRRFRMACVTSRCTSFACCGLPRFVFASSCVVLLFAAGALQALFKQSGQSWCPCSLRRVRRCSLVPPVAFRPVASRLCCQRLTACVSSTLSGSACIACSACNLGCRT